MKEKELTLNEMFLKLGIDCMTDRTESAEDPNIRFSTFDTCSISGIKFLNGEVHETRRYKRLSDTFEDAYSVLKEWGYEEAKMHVYKDQYRRKEDFLSCYYSFTSIYDIPSIKIDINKFHNDLLHINVGYSINDTTWYDSNNVKNELIKILNDLVTKSNDINLKREIKLKNILS